MLMMQIRSSLTSHTELMMLDVNPKMSSLTSDVTTKGATTRRKLSGPQPICTATKFKLPVQCRSSVLFATLCLISAACDAAQDPAKLGNTVTVSGDPEVAGLYTLCNEPPKWFAGFKDTLLSVPQGYQRDNGLFTIFRNTLGKSEWWLTDEMGAPLYAADANPDDDDLHPPATGWMYDPYLNRSDEDDPEPITLSGTVRPQPRPDPAIPSASNPAAGQTGPAPAERAQDRPSAHPTTERPTWDLKVMWIEDDCDFNYHTSMAGEYKLMKVGTADKPKWFSRDDDVDDTMDWYQHTSSGCIIYCTSWGCWRLTDSKGEPLYCHDEVGSPTPPKTRWSHRKITVKYPPRRRRLSSTGPSHAWEVHVRKHSARRRTLRSRTLMTH